MPLLLDNRYQVLHSLAEGGFGTTFLAEDTRTPSRRRCVVKQLKPVAADSGLQEIVKQRFTREAAVLEELGHDNRQIPLLYAYFEEKNQYYLVQEYVQGDTLTQRVDRTGIWSEALVHRLLRQMLPVLAYIHDRGIIHRDIKPDNIILRQKDALPVLIDFGAVKEAMNSAVSMPDKAPQSMVIGTAGFMAPEQAVGRPMFSSDLYALALTMVYCLTGKLPHELESNPSTGEIYWQRSVPQLSPALAAVLNQAISPNPHARFPTAQAMLKALETGMNAASAPKTVSPVGQAPAPETAPMPTVPSPTEAVESAPTQVASPGNWTAPSSPALTEPAPPVPNSPVPVPMTPAGYAVSKAAAPNHVDTVVPVPKKKGRWWIILACFAAALATGGLVFALALTGRMPRGLNIRLSPSITVLTPNIAGGTVTQFYQHLSNRSWDDAKSLAANSLAAQFNPQFFQQFQRISVENLKYTAKSNNRVDLIGQNTYFYADGTTQRESRTYVVQLINGQPRIVASKFVRVLQPRR